MPELAEVEYYRSKWDCGFGQRVQSVQLHAEKRIFRGSDPREIRQRLSGQRLLRSRALGKQMLFEFSGTNYVGLHLGMSGTLRVAGPDFEPEKHDHFVLRQRQQSLVFRDPRLFGRVKFHHGRATPEWWPNSTPEIGSDAFSGEFLHDFLERHRRAPLKAVLLLQSGFPGIGNWMADEILWRAKIAPSIAAGRLTTAQRWALRRATRFVSAAALSIIGRDFGDPPRSWLIHQRWKRGGKCPRHGTPLRRETIGGRTTAWCPRCQRR
ncbi:MAG: DNA-formamidopyrimidine glycosylase family protein [Chthoniobacterales bacterium]